MNKEAIKAVALSTRPNFLVLTFAVVFASFIVVLTHDVNANWSQFLGVLIAGLIAHAWVNLHNEVTDTQNGLDNFTVKTPFSGGTGGMINHPSAVQLAKKVLILGLIILTGFLIYFVKQLGWQVILLAALGGSSMLLYSRFLVKRPVWGGISAGLGFGPALVLGANWVFTSSIQTESVLLSLVIFFWVNNLLLLNQVPDWRADQRVGRNNLVIKWQSKALNLYWMFSLLSVVAMAGLLSRLTLSIDFSMPMMIWLFFWSGLILLQNIWVYQAQKHSPMEQFPEVDQQLSQNSEVSACWLRAWQKPLAVNVVINILLPLSLAALLILSL